MTMHHFHHDDDDDDDDDDEGRLRLGSAGQVKRRIVLVSGHVSLVNRPEFQLRITPKI